jgi:hypothetical protein
MFFLAGCQCLTPIILATWEAKIRRIKVLSQPEQKFTRPPQPNQYLSAVACACHPSYVGGQEQEDCRSRPTQTIKFVKLHLNRKNCVWWCAPVILATTGRVKKKDQSLDRPGQKVRPYLQNNQSKKSWTHGLSMKP